MTVAGRSDFQPISNPYIVGNPIRGSNMFFGRMDEFLYIKAKFTGKEGGGLIVLCGARRSGKTSILFQVRDGKLGPGFLPVLIDMQSMTMKDDRDFLQKLTREIVTAVDDPDVSGRALDRLSEGNPFTAFEDLIQYISTKLEGKRLILMFDEYELFETHIDSGAISTNILNLLATLIEHKSVFVLFTGSDKLEARNRPYWSVFLAKATYRRISFLSKGDTLRLICDPVKDRVTYSPEVPAEVFKLTAGQPFYTQVVCQALVDRLNECRKYKVSIEDLNGVVSEIIENPLPQMIFSWNALTSLEKLCLSAIAEINKGETRPVLADDIIRYVREHGIVYRMNRAELMRDLESLFTHDVLDKDTMTEGYTFKMDLWRFWIVRMHSIWQVVQEIGAKPSGVVLRRRILAVAAVTLSVAALVYFGARFFMPSPAKTGHLTVSAVPPAADIWLDGQLVGRGEVSLLEVPAGPHVLEASLEGYSRISKDVVVAEGEEIDLDVMTLEELTGNLELDSEPRGALISINGKPTGRRTPAELPDLTVKDAHEIVLRLADYEDANLNGIRIYPDSLIRRKVHMRKKRGDILVRSEPAGAEILVNGASTERETPQVLTLEYGRHRIGLRKNGYCDGSIDMNVNSADHVVDIEIEALPPGTLSVRVEPYADIWIDGEQAEIQKSHAKISELSQGWHEIRLRHPAFDAHVESVYVRSEATVQFSHSFTR